uniref:Uncharacterized protein n=1 Tax=Kalanchoe fedtschenkoi TaxID=63787 RepID=A0A7N0TTK8_KALFE
MIKDINGDYFIILTCESLDVSMKEHMVIVMCYMNRRRDIIKQKFVHISNTTILLLKGALNIIKYNLIISKNVFDLTNELS